MAFEYLSLRELDGPVGVNEPDRLEWLRQERRDDLMIDIWGTQELNSRGRPNLAFRLMWLDEAKAAELFKGPGTMQDQMGEAHHDELLDCPVWAMIFTGDEYSPGLGCTIDGDDSLAGILGFLAVWDELESAETTDDQREWLDRHRDDLSIWSSDLEGRVGNDA